MNITNQGSGKRRNRLTTIAVVLGLGVAGTVFVQALPGQLPARPPASGQPVPRPPASGQPSPPRIIPRQPQPRLPEEGEPRTPGVRPLPRTSKAPPDSGLLDRDKSLKFRPNRPADPTRIRHFITLGNTAEAFRLLQEARKTMGSQQVRELAHLAVN